MTDAVLVGLMVTANVLGPMLVCYLVAASYGRSRWYALAGLMHIIGIIALVILLILDDRQRMGRRLQRRSNEDGPEPTQ